MKNEGEQEREKEKKKVTTDTYIRNWILIGGKKGLSYHTTSTNLQSLKDDVHRDWAWTVANWVGVASENII